MLAIQSRASCAGAIRRSARRSSGHHHARPVVASVAPKPRGGSDNNVRGKPLQAIKSPLDTVAIATAGARHVADWFHRAPGVLRENCTGQRCRAVDSSPIDPPETTFSRELSEKRDGREHLSAASAYNDHETRICAGCDRPKSTAKRGFEHGTFPFSAFVSLQLSRRSAKRSAKRVWMPSTPTRRSWLAGLAARDWRDRCASCPHALAVSSGWALFLAELLW